MAFFNGGGVSAYGGGGGFGRPKGTIPGGGINWTLNPGGGGGGLANVYTGTDGLPLNAGNIPSWILGAVCENLSGWMKDVCLVGKQILAGSGGQSGLTNGGGTGGGTGGTACGPGYFVDPITGICLRSSDDPTPGTVTPGEASMGVTGVLLPMRVARDVLVCPKYADGKKGILWMHAMTGQVVCLPRGVNGRGFGLIRKNKPRRKPYITAAQAKHLDIHASVKKKAKEFAGKAGFTCKAKGSGRR